MALLLSRNKVKSLVDLKQASIDESSKNEEEEPRMLEWKGMLRRAFSSKKRRKKRRDRSSSCSPRASLEGSEEPPGYMYAGMSLLKPPTPKFGKRPLGVSRSNPLDSPSL